MKPPNILWICTDQQRWDTLGCYGNAFVRTPHLDRPRAGYLAPIAISDESEHYFDRLVRERGWQPTEPPAMAAGDATFHAGWTLHRAAPNTTGKMREVMTVIYFADGARIAPMTTGNAGDLKSLFPGLQTDDVAASPLTPVLYAEPA